MEQQLSVKKTRVFKRSVFVEGHKTSVSLEDEFWNALVNTAAAEKLAPNRLIEKIKRDRNNPNLSSAIRVFLLNYVRQRMPPEKLVAFGAHTKK